MKSKDDPADYASRGATIEQLASSDRFVGPNFLWKSFLPTCSDVDVNISDRDPEVRAHVMASSIERTDVSIFDRFSKWFVVLRVVAVCLKFRDALMIKTHRCTEDIIPPDSVGGNGEIQDEIYTLLDKGKLSLSSKLAQLDPFIDDKGLLRVGGRVEQSSFLYGVKHPLIIPRYSHMTSLIIQHYHEKTMHQGRGLTMNAIRSSGFWIVGCTRAVLTYIFKCGTCRRLRGNELGQKMSDLPVERL